MNVQIIRQTDRQKDTHRQSNDRDYDRERASDQEQVRVRKTPWDDVRIGLNNTRVNKPSHFMPFQKYRVWQVQLNDPAVFVQLAPPLVQ